MIDGISTRNRATMEKVISFVEVESLYGATGYPLRTPRLEDTVLDAHTREPITVITERYLDVLRFGRWSQPGHNQKLTQFISEIRVKRTIDVLYKLSQNRHNYWVLYLGGNTSIQEKTIEFSILYRHLIFSFVYWYKRQVLLLLMICIYV